MSVYAVIHTGGKQCKVQEGDELNIERLHLSDKDKSVRLDRVLLLSKGAELSVGHPYLEGAFCEAEVLGEVKGPKVISFKYIRREKSATKTGHRQIYTKIRIKAIHSGR